MRLGGIGEVGDLGVRQEHLLRLADPGEPYAGGHVAGETAVAERLRQQEREDAVRLPNGWGAETGVGQVERLCAWSTSGAGIRPLR
ncbi:hypothetical protein Aca07nite_18470 [Actinoplanes capillaceus]|uniref:Uncharacterized protein n=1 Tax=Actinoplanes campanulatus TaxID=113559 RepID=A0ABQ3WC52_9ACTN|nr:hypothetical protein Aca07nite_18470 [Actinoplanes capillaceus]